MAVVLIGLDPADEPEVQKVVDSLVRGKVKRALVAKAQVDLDRAQAKWRADAKKMTKAKYRDAVASRDAEIADLYAAFVAAQKGE